MIFFLSIKPGIPTLLAFYIMFLVLMITQSCKKEAAPAVEAPRLELLTSVKWEIEAAGFDDDSSGQIESYENILTDCQQDNTLEFFPDGKGISKDNAMICNSDSLSSQFTWTFTQNQTHLLMSNTELRILLLNNKEMTLALEAYLSTPFLVHYLAK